MPEGPLILLARALSSMMHRPPSDPYVVDVARTLRDGAWPLSDLVEGGEGVVVFRWDNGRLLVLADTDKYRRYVVRVL